MAAERIIEMPKAKRIFLFWFGILGVILVIIPFTVLSIFKLPLSETSMTVIIIEGVIIILLSLLGNLPQ